MTPARALLAFALAAGLALPQSALAQGVSSQGVSSLSLDAAIALAQRNNPGLAQVKAQADAAGARLTQARSGRMPTLGLSGEAGRGTTDLGGFFGFGRADVSPRAAALELRLPVFSGGAASAAIDRAREGRDAMLAQVGGARALLAAEAAEAYVAVLSAREILALNESQLRQMSEIARQADLRFTGGEIPRTDKAQAEARLAEARAGLARAQGDVARSEARFRTVVGVEPDVLDAPLGPPPVPPTLDDAVSAAMRTSPVLTAAEAQARAAEAQARYAQAERLPSLALTGQANSARDQFFPGYRADGLTIGVQGRWTLFSGGLTSGRIAEARADASAAHAGVEAARAQVREAVIGAWADVRTAQALVAASADQAAAAASALDSVRNEVRVGQKPTLDLLDAEREALAARSAMVAARGGVVTAAYRLNALIGGG